jgi:ubiquinone/menaquinone biosynthesis C-methylase UbiE
MVTESIQNVYEDADRARAYADLEFPGTYFLAFRDLPGLLRKHVSGRRALDFGCGTGRSTRFLREMAFEVIGVDLSAAMLDHARTRDPQGEYRLVADGNLGGFATGTFDLILAAFTFDNSTDGQKASALRELRRRTVVRWSTSSVPMPITVSFSTLSALPSWTPPRRWRAARSQFNG